MSLMEKYMGELNDPHDLISGKCISKNVIDFELREMIGKDYETPESV